MKCHLKMAKYYFDALDETKSIKTGLNIYPSQLLDFTYLKDQNRCCNCG